MPADYLAALSVERREAMWKETVESGQPELWVARDDGGRVAGWVSFGACRDEDAPSSQAEVWAIYVAPKRWSTGVGRQLWLRTRAALSLRGYRTCSLWVFSQNEQAIRFYESVGFAADDRPVQQFELGGRQLEEVRYVCRIERPSPDA